MGEPSVFQTVHRIVNAIPAGRVMSYGQVGELAGCNPRTVGWAMATSPENTPWHRVVGVDGTLRVGKKSPLAESEQRERLIEEGVHFDGANTVDMTRSRFGVLESDTLLFDDAGSDPSVES